MGDPPPTDEKERFEVCHSILLSAPPGQFDLILSDLRSIRQLSDEWANSVRKEYASRTGRDVLTDSADVGNNGVENVCGDERTEGIASALRERMSACMTENYSSNSSFSHKVVSLSSEEIVVKTYAERLDLRNYNAASWSSVYMLGVPKEGRATMTGSIDLRSHSFENGNVQLRSKIDALGPATVSGDGPEALADAVARQISTWEYDDAQGRLASMYESLGDTTLKSLRRVMPVTRTRMDWNVRAHRVARTFAAGSEKIVVDGAASVSAGGMGTE